MDVFSEADRTMRFNPTTRLEKHGFEAFRQHWGRFFRNKLNGRRDLTTGAYSDTLENIDAFVKAFTRHYHPYVTGTHVYQPIFQYDYNNKIALFLWLYCSWPQSGKVNYVESQKRYAILQKLIKASMEAVQNIQTKTGMDMTEELEKLRTMQNEPDFNFINTATDYFDYVVGTPRRSLVAPPPPVADVVEETAEALAAVVVAPVAVTEVVTAQVVQDPGCSIC